MSNLEEKPTVKPRKRFVGRAKKNTATTDAGEAIEEGAVGFASNDRNTRVFFNANSITCSFRGTKRTYRSYG